MPKPHDMTSMGGPDGRFQGTCWTEIFEAKTLDETGREKAVNEISGKYWKPVYCYLRRRGYSNESAKDLTQGFFCEVVLGRQLIERADPTKGRFRTFLLTALDHYVSDVYHKEAAHKRSPKGQVLPLETNDVAGLLETHAKSTPDEVFNYAWACGVLNHVFAKVKHECCTADKETHWNVFHARVVAPIVESTQAPGLSELCAKYDVKDNPTASNMIDYVKKRFHSALRRHLRQFVQSDSEVDEEFREIFEILAKSSSR